MERKARRGTRRLYRIANDRYGVVICSNHPSQIKESREEPYKEVVVSFFNTLFGHSNTSKSFWSDPKLKSDIDTYFPTTFGSNIIDKGNETHGNDDRTDLRSQLDMCQLFTRLHGLTDITFSPFCQLGIDPSSMQKVFISLD